MPREEVGVLSPNTEGEAKEEMGARKGLSLVGLGTHSVLG